MRPVQKRNWPIENGLQKSYKPHTIAKTDLEDHLGCFCSYCEVFSSDLEVEHVISKYQDKSLLNDWNNFLLACGRCNGKDNKSNKPVNLSATHFPHLNNTILSFVYGEGGLVSINPQLSGDSIIHARNMLNLVGLDKYPGNPRYEKHNPNDTRWKHRRITWEYAMKYLPIYEKGSLSAQQLVEFAIQRGYFSVWFSVFQNHPEVKKLLIDTFVGTSHNCFDTDNNYQPIARNPHSVNDKI
jgi:hypothetical protein